MMSRPLQPVIVLVYTPGEGVEGRCFFFLGGGGGGGRNSSEGGVSRVFTRGVYFGFVLT